MISRDHSEKYFENDIALGLVKQGWQRSETDEGYDVLTGLYEDDLIAWMETAYKDAFDAYKKSNPKWRETLVARVVEVLTQKGTIRALQETIGMTGMPYFKLSEKEPENRENADVVRRYSCNILRVVQQVHFRVESRESIDLVFFINGIPVATAEVKTNFVQDINRAVEQYRHDRHPKFKGKGKESVLLKHGRGAVVHFAISETDIQMTTKLEGETTRFLPFNQGNDGHAGNPHATIDKPYPVSYFWEEVCQRDTWLRIFHSFVFTETKIRTTEFGNKRTEHALIFPRYHQLRAVTNIVNDAVKNGVGYPYLIEHSPGSGKTKTITWTAFRLTEIRKDNGEAVFDTVLIITDRTNLNDQLLAAVQAFNRTPGLVKGIDRRDGSTKTASLQEALEKGVRIVVVTIQTFPFAMEQIILNEKLKGRSFAVIVDEAHNSQSSSSSSKLNAALGLAGEQLTYETLEDFMLAVQKSHKRPANVSFLGFTATPRHQTYMLFGRHKDGSRVNLNDNDENNLPKSFDVYPMRQAIEEGFILDVLEGYTPYKTAWQLEHQGDYDPLLNVRDTKRTLTKWLNLHPTNVSQKMDFIVKHFTRNIAGLLNGQAKAMIVTSSRAAVVRYKLAFDKYLKEHPELNQNTVLKLGIPVAAFSGTVDGVDAVHPEDKKEGFTLVDPEAAFDEGTLNPSIKGAIDVAFDKDEYRLLIVADKYQTGFDQPKLCAMYIDKPIGSEIDIVQTYSRLNRIYKGKEATFIVDFVNKPDDVRKAFARYDSGSSIKEIQNPNVIFTLVDSVYNARVFTKEDVDGFGFKYYYEKIRAFSEGRKFEESHAVLNAIFEPLAQNFNEQLIQCYEECQYLTKQLEQDEQSSNAARIQATRDALENMTRDRNVLENFRKSLNKTVSTYNYLAQLTEFKNPDLELFVAFCGLLSKYLKRVPREEIDISGILLTGYTLKPIRDPGGDEQEPKPLVGISGVSNEPGSDMPSHLKEILEMINNFVGDKLGYENAKRYCFSISDKMRENNKVMVQVRNNEPDVAREGYLKTAVRGAVQDLFGDYEDLTRAVMSSDVKRDELVDIVLRILQTNAKETDLRG